MKQREKLASKRSLSPVKKQRTQKPSHESPKTRDEAEEAYYSRFDIDLDNCLASWFNYFRNTSSVIHKQPWQILWWTLFCWCWTYCRLSQHGGAKSGFARWLIESVLAITE